MRRGLLVLLAMAAMLLWMRRGRSPAAPRERAPAMGAADARRLERDMARA